MRTVLVLNHVTLDGVMQAPGRPDEDTRGGFEHGGWAVADSDSAQGQMIREGILRPTDLLFGRRTYEDFFSVWPNRRDNPYSEALDNARKYVASRTLEEPLPWKNSTLLRGDAADAVAELKAEAGNDLLIMGSGVLIDALARRGLIDEYLLFIHPVVLGTGRRLFNDGGANAKLALVKCAPTTTGVIFAAYRRA